MRKKQRLKLKESDTNKKLKLREKGLELKMNKQDLRRKRDSGLKKRSNGFAERKKIRGCSLKLRDPENLPGKKNCRRCFKRRDRKSSDKKNCLERLKSFRLSLKLTVLSLSEMKLRLRGLRQKRTKKI